VERGCPLSRMRGPGVAEAETEARRGVGAETEVRRGGGGVATGGSSGGESISAEAKVRGNGAPDIYIYGCHFSTGPRHRPVLNWRQRRLVPGVATARY